MDDHLIATHIDVNSGSSKYIPPRFIRAEEKQVFDYQIITPLQGKTILKIDTIKSQKTVRLFSNNDKYKIIHIPGFQTIQRVINEKKAEKNDVENLKITLFNSVTETDLLPNSIIENPKELKMTWGNILAQPESENVALKEFYQNKVKSLKLFYQNKELDLQKFRVTVYSKNKWYSKNCSIYDFKNPDFLNKIGKGTSIFIDKLVIKDKGVQKHLQRRFLFKVGNEVFPNQNKKETERKENYELKWGNIDLPLILNKNTNAATARFMTQKDFLENIDQVVYANQKWKKDGQSIYSIHLI